MRILTNNRYKCAHDVGVKLFFDNNSDETLRTYAIEIRFGKNYIPEEDKSDFTALLRSSDEKDRNTATRVFINDLKDGMEDLPFDMIPYVYANIDLSHVYLRNWLCKVLDERGLMPEELKNESMYDADKEIRELFLKTKK